MGDVKRVSRFLVINPHSGGSRPTPEELEDAARERGITVHVLGEGDDVEALARETDAEVLGMVGGDGSLAAVAAVAVERDAPFVCVPFGTRNHFARDVGLDGNDPLRALGAFDGSERRVDVGLVGERVFLNNVSLGVYARLVHRRERHRRRRELAARAHALWLSLRDRSPGAFLVDRQVVSARVLLIANNAYTLSPLSIGERERIDTGLLHLYVANGVLPRAWDERSAERFTVDSDRNHVRAAIDGEPALLETPIEFSVAPRALRLLFPPD